jgi:DNA-binding beta-propeller fold protein YncE
MLLLLFKDAIKTANFVKNIPEQKRPYFYGIILSAVFLSLTAFLAPSVSSAQTRGPKKAQTNPRLASEHYAKAVTAVQSGDCEKLRKELLKAARFGYKVDDELAEEWGCRCGVAVDDGVFYSLGLSSMAVSKSGRTAAAATIDGKIFIFDILSSKVIQHWDTRLSEVVDIDFTKDGRYVAAGGDKTVLVLDIAEKKQKWETMFDSYISRVRFSPDGKSLAVSMNKIISSNESGISMVGFIRHVPLSGNRVGVSMKNVPGNPADIAVTSDGKRIVAYLWPEKFSYSTVSNLCIWDAQTGEKELCREMQTSTMYPANLSRDGKILAYARLADNAIAENKKSLDKKGRIKKPRDLSGSAWLREPTNYVATAHDVFKGNEIPIISGNYILALDYNGKNAVVLTAENKIVYEKIGSGKAYKVGFETFSKKQGDLLYAAFGSGVILTGKTNSDLQRFGFSKYEIPDHGKKLEGISQAAR